MIDIENNTNIIMKNGKCIQRDVKLESAVVK